MRACVLTLSVVGLLVLGSGPMDAAVQYPLTLTLDAQVTSGVTTVTSKVTVRVTGQMIDSQRKRVTDALKFGGYPNFLPALRALPATGTVETQNGKVEIKYTREEQDAEGSRLVLVADHPLFFLGGAAGKAKAGYELTVVELRLDGKGGVTGQMSGAARVKPAPDGSVLLDDYAEALVQLKGQVEK